MKTVNTLVALMSFLFLKAQNPYQPEWSQKDYKSVIEKGITNYKKNKKDSIASYYLGMSYSALGETDNAIKFLKNAKASGLNVYTIPYNLSINYTKNGYIDLALEELEVASTMPGMTYNQIDKDDFNPLNNNLKFKEIKNKLYKLSYPCKADSNYRKFDFWVGEWDVYTQGQKIAESSITLTNGDCGILENYRPFGRAGGNSISYYDSSDGKWKQNWVASGNVSHYKEPDNVTDGNMQIVAESVQNGQKVLLRMTYYDNKNDGTVRQLMDRSVDEGNTWTIIYDGIYKPKNEQ